MTLKEVLEKLPEDIEDKVSAVSYMEDGYNITLYWEDEDEYVNIAEVTYYDDGYYLFDFESFEKGYPKTASYIINKKSMQVIKKLIESLGGKL